MLCQCLERAICLQSILPVVFRSTPTSRRYTCHRGFTSHTVRIWISTRWQRAAPMWNTLASRRSKTTSSSSIPRGTRRLSPSRGLMCRARCGTSIAATRPSSMASRASRPAAATRKTSRSTSWASMTRTTSSTATKSAVLQASRSTRSSTFPTARRFRDAAVGDATDRAHAAEG